MQPLVQRIKETVEKSQILREEKLSEIETNLDYVAVFCQSNKEYDQYNEEADKLGKVYKEDSNGITYILIDQIDTVEGPLSLVKIRKYEEEKSQLGAPDYSVTGYLKIKEDLVNEGIAEIKKAADGEEILEVMGDDVIIYIPENPLSAEIKSLDNEIDSIEENDMDTKLELEKEKRVRLMADFENYKKRIEQEKATFGAIANMSLIQELLEINDDLGLALDDSELNLDRAKESITNAREKLKATAMNAGIETVEVKPGDEFDKEKMEAIQVIPNPEMSNKVIAVISSAYKYSNKEGILKAAKVIVGK
jgi:molecular chaperone GrpE